MNAIKKVFNKDEDSKSDHVSHSSHNNHTTGTESHNIVSNEHSTAASHIQGTPKEGENRGLSHPEVVEKHQMPGDHATHDHKHLAPVTQETQHHHETEEVQRVRDVDRHVHHVQHHVQPVLDTKHHDREHSEKVVEPTKIHEQHVNTENDKKIFASLNKHHDKVEHGQDVKKIVDKGEIVNENVTEHVHHVVQPIIQRDTHSHHTIHTTVPIHQTTHEAPIIHQASEHEPMRLKDFVAGGGDLKSNLTHDNAGVLADGKCERKAEGPAELLAEKLHIGSNH